MATPPSGQWIGLNEMQESENKVIQGVFEQDTEYFEPKIKNISNQAHLENRFDKAFIKVMIDDPDDDKALKYIEQYITKNRVHENLQGISNDFKDLVVSIIEGSVENENSDSLQKCLDWFDNVVLEKEDMRRLTFLWEYDIKRNNIAMLRACEKDNFKMVLSFMKYGYVLDRKFVDDSYYPGSRVCALLCLKYENHMSDFLFCFRVLSATTKPAFMLAQLHDQIDKEFEDFDVYSTPFEDMEFKSTFENKDPLTNAFKHIHEASQLRKKYVEYESKFKEIEMENKKFTVQMLDQCKTSKEAAIIFSNDLNAYGNFGGLLNAKIAYPRIEAAIRTNNVEFVAHDFCQQVLGEKLVKSDLTGEILYWNSANWLDKSIYIFFCLIMMPMSIIGKVLTDITSCCIKTSERVETDPEAAQVSKKNCPFDSFYSVPINRFIAHATSSVLFLGLVVSHVFHPDNGCLVSIIFAYAISFMARDIAGVLQRKNKFDDFGFWNVYALVNDIFLLIGSTLKIMILYRGIGETVVTQGALNVSKSNVTDFTEDILESEKMIEIESCMMGMAVSMTIMKLLYWCQLSQWLGPLAISIRRVFKDIVMVVSVYLVYFVAFTLGIHFIMDLQPFNETNNCTDAENRFSALGLLHSNDTVSAWKTTLWALFDPGHPDYLGCYKGFARTTALSLWGIYQVVNVVMLLNLLVALMTNTMALIEKDKDANWKFKRTEIWLKFCDDTSLPPPFNIFDLFLSLVKHQSVKLVKQKKEIKKPNNDELMKYIILVSKLSGRYIRHLEDSGDSEATRENLGNAKRDILNKVKSYRTSEMKKKENLMLSKSNEDKIVKTAVENVPSTTARRPGNQQMAEDGRLINTD